MLGTGNMVRGDGKTSRVRAGAVGGRMKPVRYIHYRTCIDATCTHKKPHERETHTMSGIHPYDPVHCTQWVECHAGKTRCVRVRESK
jgi:hypothetical protein